MHEIYNFKFCSTKFDKIIFFFSLRVYNFFRILGGIMIFNIYGTYSLYQLLGWVLVFVGLIVCNELARRTKIGGIIFFLAIPACLTIYFVILTVWGSVDSNSWAASNWTFTKMNSWFHYAKLYAATAGCIGFMMIKYGCELVNNVGLNLSHLSLSQLTF